MAAAPAYPSPLTPTRTVVTIGNFDGVHAGHAALVRRARQIADPASAEVLAMVFDPHPLTALRPDQAPPRLSGFDQRERWLRELGADRILRLSPDPATLNQAPEDFVHRVVADHRPLAFVEGTDFRFGKGRSGTVALLAGLGRKLGFEVITIPPVEAALSDLTCVTVSSSLVRWLVSAGRVGDAALLLGRPHELEGRVVPGDRRGRRIGFPTANLVAEGLPPADGVYAGVATLDDGRALAAAVSVGDKPTYGGVERAIEAYLLPGPGVPQGEWACLPGLPEYGWSMRLRLLEWVRDQVRFGSTQELIAQMTRDCERIARIVEESGAAPGEAA